MQESQNICRICHSLGDEPLITPCHCSGSAKHVHATCLLTWFKKAVKNTCELCRHKVAIKKKGRPYSEVVDMYFLTLIHVCLVHNYKLCSYYSKWHTWKKFIQSQRFLKAKNSQFFCNWANKTQGSTMQRLKMLKPFELTWRLRKQPSNLWMLSVHSQKKKKYCASFLFRKRCDWIIFQEPWFGQSCCKCLF